MTHERSQGRANIPTAQLQNPLLKPSLPTPSCPQSSAAAPVLPASVRLPVPHNSRERNHTEHNVPEARARPFQGQELFPCGRTPVGCSFCPSANMWVISTFWAPRTVLLRPGLCSFCLDTCVRFPGTRAGVEWLGHLVALCLPPPPPSSLPPSPQQLYRTSSQPHRNCASLLRWKHMPHPLAWPAPPTQDAGSLPHSSQATGPTLPPGVDSVDSGEELGSDFEVGYPAQPQVLLTQSRSSQSWVQWL